jgi:hypothetical protein
MISVDNPIPVWYNLGMKGKQQMKTKAKKPASSTFEVESENYRSQYTIVKFDFKFIK